MRSSVFMSYPQSPAHNIAIGASSMPPATSRISKQSTANQTKSNIEGENRRASTFPEPPHKRLRTSQWVGNINQPADMNNGKGVITRPGFVDLTRQTQFQPHAGAKRLVIKNLRTSNGKAADEYYNKVWGELDDALTSIFHGDKITTPLEVLARGVEVTCRRNRSPELAAHLKDRTRTYLEKKLLPVIEAEAGPNHVETLRAVYKFWIRWIELSTLIRSIFSYLDRSYLLTARDCLQLEDLSITQFRQVIFHKGKKCSENSLISRVVAGVCELVEYDRTLQKDLFDSELLRSSISMLHISGTYDKLFEPEFLRTSDMYFKLFARERSNSELSDYVSACDKLLARESVRCDTYNFDSSTKRSLLDQAHKSLIAQCAGVLLNTQKISKLMDDNDLHSLKLLYGLLCLSNIQLKLRDPWEAYIKSAGSLIVSDKEKVTEMIVRLLELKRKLDLIIRDGFNKDEAFSFALREAFSNFINDRKNTSALGPGTSVVGEMISKYLDMLLRNGLKSVPRSLEFDSKDRDAAEKAGQSSTGDEDAELDRQLEQGLELFRFIEGKDVFEAFYKKDLARRLLMGRSASSDAERNMLAKLKAECGSSFTHNLEQMFKDQQLARDEMIAYKQSTGNSGKTALDLQVSVLSSSAWPTYPDVECKLPSEVARQIEKYDAHYKHKHSGRKLAWKHALAHSIVTAQFNKGKKELLVSGFQAIVILLFNNIDTDGNLSYADIAAATGLVDVELQRTLQSLACAKIRVLTKAPKGREVNPTDTFTVNLNFTDPKIRIKINQIQLKETKEENKETHDRVSQDREYETQAAIVRIMKSRKRMAHQALIPEVIDQMKKRGHVEVALIKKCIERLLEKEYIERDGDHYEYLA